MFTEFYVQKGGVPGEPTESPLPLTPPEIEKQIIDQLIDPSNMLNQQLKEIIDNFNNLTPLTIRKKEKTDNNEIKSYDSYIRMKFLIDVLLDRDNTTSETISSEDNTQETSDGPINYTLLKLIQKVKAELKKEDLPAKEITDSLNELYPQTSSV